MSADPACIAAVWKYPPMPAAAAPPLDDVVTPPTADGLDDLLVHAARESPDKLALVEASGRSLTWRELDAEVARVATGLGDAGVVAGYRVALVLGNRLEMVTGYLAVLRAQAVAVRAAVARVAAAVVPRAAVVPAARAVVARPVAVAPAARAAAPAPARHAKAPCLCLAGLL